MENNIVPESTPAPIHIAVLGADDPEMTRNEELLLDADVLVAYAAWENPKTGEIARVHPGVAYRATKVLFPVAGGLLLPIDSVAFAEAFASANILTVECALAGLASSLVADHHNPGDPGFGRPPAEFFSASSLGQVVAHLARSKQLDYYRWDLATGGHETPPPIGEICQNVDGEVYVCINHWAGLGDYETCTLALIPRELVLAAAADHCLGGAYRGECPGIDRDELLEFRIATQVAFRNSNPREGEAPVTRKGLLEDVKRAIGALESAPEVPGIPGMKDIRHHHLFLSPEGEKVIASSYEGEVLSEVVPQLPEAGTYTGTGYFSGPLTDPREGRRKFTCSGTPEQVRAWLNKAEEFGLVDTYGDPARGFAGGYLKE